jgi:hypothetical protein
MARKARGKTKVLGRAYWAAVAAKQGRGRRVAKATLVNACTRGGASRDDCERVVSAGLKGRRKARKSGTPWKRRKSMSRAAKAVRAGFKASAKSCKGRRLTAFRACMRKTAPREIRSRM